MLLGGPPFVANHVKDRCLIMVDRPQEDVMHWTLYISMEPGVWVSRYVHVIYDNICYTYSYIPWCIRKNCTQVCFNYIRPAPGLDSEALSGCEWGACWSDGRSWGETGRQMRKFDDIWSWDFDLIHFLHEWRNGHWMCCAAPHLHPLLSLSSSRGSEGLGAVTCWNMTNKQKNKFSGEKVPGTVNREMHAEFCRGADTKVVATHGAPGTWMIKYD